MTRLAICSHRSRRLAIRRSAARSTSKPPITAQQARTYTSWILQQSWPTPNQFKQQTKIRQLEWREALMVVVVAHQPIAEFEKWKVLEAQCKMITIWSSKGEGKPILRLSSRVRLIWRETKRGSPRQCTWIRMTSCKRLKKTHLTNSLKSLRSRSFRSTPRNKMLWLFSPISNPSFNYRRWL